MMLHQKIKLTTGVINGVLKIALQAIGKNFTENEINALLLLNTKTVDYGLKPSVIDIRVNVTDAGGLYPVS